MSLALTTAKLLSDAVHLQANATVRLGTASWRCLHQDFATREPYVDHGAGKKTEQTDTLHIPRFGPSPEQEARRFAFAVGQQVQLGFDVDAPAVAPRAVRIRAVIETPGTVNLQVTHPQE